MAAAIIHLELKTQNLELNKKRLSNMYKAKINVTLKKSVLDPQGQTVLHALQSMNFKETQDIRVGKFFEVTLDASNESDAKNRLQEMCGKLLINPVIEDYQMSIEKV